MSVLTASSRFFGLLYHVLWAAKRYPEQWSPPGLRDERRTSALIRVSVFWLYGGDFATGSGVMRNGKLRECGELRPKWEIDNFFCSHCRTSSVHFGQGRVGARNTRASRWLGFRFLGSLSFALLLSLSPIVLPPKFLNFREIGFSPISEPSTCDIFGDWHGD